MRVQNNQATSTEEVLHGQMILSKFSILIKKERSRYEKQAEALLVSGQLSYQLGAVHLEFRIQDGFFHFESSTYTDSGLTHSAKFPISEIRSEQFDDLIELFAQSEASLEN